MPLVSIIIPSYNDGKYINDAVNSVLNQVFENYEIIIINDGSTDNQTIAQYDILAKNPLIKLIHKQNEGIAKARNSGINNASGEFIVPLDSDDEIKSDFLEKTVKLLNSVDSDVAIINTNGEFFGEKDGIFTKSDYDLGLLAWENCIGNCCLFRKSAWDEVEGYSVNINGYEDWDFWMKIISKGYKWKHIEEVLIRHRYRSDSYSRTNNKKNYNSLTNTLLENNKEFFQRNYKEIYLKGKQRWYLEFLKTKNINS
jgi:glycosyltransferase involved in cell wall biosynthesis